MAYIEPPSPSGEKLKAAWNEPAIKDWLSHYGVAVLVERGNTTYRPWDMPRLLEDGTCVAYVDGREYDRDVGLGDATELLDWMARVQQRRIDAAYADARFAAESGGTLARRAGIRALRLARQGTPTLALEGITQSLRRKPLEFDEGDMLVAQVGRVISKANPTAQQTLERLALETSHAWDPATFHDRAGPIRSDRNIPDPPNEQLAEMMRFSLLCIACNRTDLVKFRIQEIDAGAPSSNESEWLSSIAAHSFFMVGCTADPPELELMAACGILQDDPEAALEEIVRPTMLVMALSDASRESTKKQLGPLFKGIGARAAILWCSLRCAGRDSDARALVDKVVAIADHPAMRAGFLSMCISTGVLPDETDSWLAGKDMDPVAVSQLRDGIRLMRPLTPRTPPTARTLPDSR